MGVLLPKILPRRRLHEQRRLTLQGQAETDEAIAICEVVDDKIGRLTLVRGVKKISG